MRMKTLIIIPTYNEYENLQPLLSSIFSYAPHTDILIVDDNSPDGTGELADQLHDVLDVEAAARPAGMASRSHHALAGRGLSNGSRQREGMVAENRRIRRTRLSGCSGLHGSRQLGH